MLEVFRLILL